MNVFDPGKFLRPQGRPEIRKYPDGDEFMSKIIFANEVYNGREVTLFTTEEPHGAIDLYLQGGGNPQGFPADFFIYAINGGIRAPVARARLFGGDYGGVPISPIAPIDVNAGAIYVCGARVAAEKYEITYKTIDNLLVPPPPNDLIVSAYATRFLPAAPEFAGCYYPFRDGVSGQQKGSTIAASFSAGAGRMVLQASGVNTTATRRYFQIWDSLDFGPPVTGLVWVENIPASGDFHFSLPVNPAAAGLQLRNGCFLGISTSPTAFVAATVGDVVWNAILQ